MAKVEETRPLRADAQRNRDKLLSVALTAFAQSGAEASLEAIAKDAGVGIGTLYRNFPTREALILAVYWREVEQLGEAATDLLNAMPPDRALRQWMDRVALYAMTKRGLAAALRTATSSDKELLGATYDQMVAAITTLLDASAQAGTIRADLKPGDVLLAMGGLFLLDAKDGWQDQAGRLLDLLMDGLRAGASNPPTPDVSAQ